MSDHALSAFLLTAYCLYQSFSRAIYFRGIHTCLSHVGHFLRFLLEMYNKALEVERQANADRGAFVANVSHGILNPPPPLFFPSLISSPFNGVSHV